MKIFNLMLVLLVLSLVVVVGGCGSKFQLSALEVSPDVCYRGQTVTVSTTVTYSGDVAADYEAELKVDDDVEQTGVFSFEPGSSQLLSFDLSRVEPGNYTVRLGNQKASFTVLGVSNFNISHDEVEVDQPVTITADLQNVTEDEVSYCCCLFCGGEEVQSQSITLAADSASQVTFDLSRSSAGWYEVEFLGFSESFKVLKPAEFVIIDFDVSPNPVKVGGMTTITAEIENVGEVEGTDEVSLLVDGVVEESNEVTLSAGAVTTEFFSLSRDAEGSYSIQLGNQQVELQVVQPVRLSTGTILLNEFSGGASHLRIINQGDSDVVVVLSSAEEPEVPLWAAYVRSDDSRTFTRIYRGIYIIYFTFGEDWCEETGKFLTVYGYHRFAEEADVTETAYTYSIWTLTFGAEIGEGSPSLDLDEDEFPSLE